MSDPLLHTEKELLLKTAVGDEAAFSVLFKTHYNQLGGFILRITASEQLTQEIVQDVFMKVWINRRSLAGINCFKAYLLVVGRNHAFNCLKQLAREKSRKKIWVDTVLQQAVNDADEATLADTGKLIEEAIALLPPRQKEVYLLSRSHGLQQAEIARTMHISLETVKKHMVLALRFLKNHLRSQTNFFFLFIAAFLRA